MSADQTNWEDFHKEQEVFLQKRFKKWKKAGKIKDDSEIFQEYKDAKGMLLQRHRQESMFRTVRENNTIIKADYSNKKEFYKIK